MALSPDGRIIYQPSFEKDQWYVLDAVSGDEITRITPNSRAHNTVYGLDGKRCYLAGLGSPVLSVADTTEGPVRQATSPPADP
jgi:DNA-binding beta-propeller fold protein YncE